MELEKYNLRSVFINRDMSMISITPVVYVSHPPAILYSDDCGHRKLRRFVEEAGFQQNTIRLILGLNNSKQQIGELTRLLM